MKKHHDIQDIAFSGGRLKISIDGEKHEFELSKISTRLANASHSERSKFVISSSGYGIHWPQIDEDLSVDRLISAKKTTGKPSARANEK